MSEFDAKDHFEALFNANYIRWFHLNGQPALVEITGLDKGVELTLPGGAKTKGAVLHLKQIKGAVAEMKPLVLNRANGNSIAEIHGPKPSGWVGKQIVLFQDTTKLKGKTVPCIRIRARKDEK